MGKQGMNKQNYLGNISTKQIKSHKLLVLFKSSHTIPGYTGKTIIRDTYDINMSASSGCF